LDSAEGAAAAQLSGGGAGFQESQGAERRRHDRAGRARQNEGGRRRNQRSRRQFHRYHAGRHVPRRAPPDRPGPQPGARTVSGRSGTGTHGLVAEGAAVMEDAGPPRRMRGLLLAGLVLLVGAGALLVSLHTFGDKLRASLRGEARYQVEFTAIVCEAPPALTRENFLTEVQYLAEMPDHFRILERELNARLAEGFRRHPWVAKVESVEIQPAPRVQVRLRFRQPVLAVQTDDKVRVVDSDGVLLPLGTSAKGMPVFEGKA